MDTRRWNSKGLYKFELLILLSLVLNGCGSENMADFDDGDWGTPQTVANLNLAPTTKEGQQVVDLTASPDEVTTIVKKGLNQTDEFIGYSSDGTAFQSYIGADGSFRFEGDVNNYIAFDGSTFTINSDNLNIDNAGNAEFTGELTTEDILLINDANNTVWQETKGSVKTPDVFETDNRIYPYNATADTRKKMKGASKGVIESDARGFININSAFVPYSVQLRMGLVYSFFYDPSIQILDSITVDFGAKQTVYAPTFDSIPAINSGSTIGDYFLEPTEEFYFKKQDLSPTQRRVFIFMAKIKINSVSGNTPFNITANLDTGNVSSELFSNILLNNKL